MLFCCVVFGCVLSLFWLLFISIVGLIIAVAFLLFLEPCSEREELFVNGDYFLFACCCCGVMLSGYGTDLSHTTLPKFLKRSSGDADPGHIVWDRSVPYYVASVCIARRTFQEHLPHSMGQICPILCGRGRGWSGEIIFGSRPHSMGQICPILCGLVREKSLLRTQHLHPGHIVWDRSVPYYVAWFGCWVRTRDFSQTKPHSMGQVCPILCGLLPRLISPRPTSTQAT